MSMQRRALQKREKLALSAMLAVAAAIGVTEIWFPEAEPEMLTRAVAPTSAPVLVAARSAAETATDSAAEVSSVALAVPAPAPAASDEKTASAIAPEAAATPAETPAPGVTNVFPAQTWQPPPPPPPPPPKPTAPPLPFQYGGKLMQGDEWVVFLFQQKRQHIVRAGDAIDNLYRVEAIMPGRIEFTYLPLKQKQELLTGSPS